MAFPIVVNRLISDSELSTFCTYLDQAKRFQGQYVRIRGNATTNYTNGFTPRGFDMVGIGDSRLYGVTNSGTFTYVDGWFATLKIRCQFAANRNTTYGHSATVIGGAGFLPLANSPVASGFGSWPTGQGLNVTGTGGTWKGYANSDTPGCRHYETSATTVGYVLDCNGAATGFSAQLRAGCTDFELVGERFSTGGTITVKLQETGGTNSWTHGTTWSQSGAASYAYRSSKYQISSYAGGGTVNSTSFRIRSETSGAADNKVAGWLVYRDDYNEGFRAHNFGASGMVLSNRSANSLTGIKTFFAGGAAGAVNGGLFVMNVGGYNELQAAQSASTFKTAITNWCTQIMACATAPGGILIIDPRPDFSASPFDGVPTAEALYLAYKVAAYEVAASLGGIVIIDLDKYCGYSNTTAVALGLIGSDNLHPTMAGQALMQEIVYSVMTYGDMGKLLYGFR